MKNKITFLILFLLCKTLLAKQNTESNGSTNINDAITVRIEQTINDQSKYLYSIKLFVHNQQSDTIHIRSSFTIDVPRGLSYILIYSCQHANDSLICNYDWPKSWEDTRPLVVEYFDRKLSIAPKETISLEIPVRSDYAETEVYFKVQIPVIYHGEVHYFKEETNKIYLTKIERCN